MSGNRRVLFVCAGNTCRSPLAVALASRHIPAVDAESAGLMRGYAVAPHAVTVAAELAGVDLTDHEPRNVSDVSVGAFDIVVAMDSMVANALTGGADLPRRLVTWDVKDPYGGTLDDYRRAAEEIVGHLAELSV